MTRNLTREELYELAWSKPMTHVAKELGVSDVMVGSYAEKKWSLNHRVAIGPILSPISRWFFTSSLPYRICFREEQISIR